MQLPVCQLERCVGRRAAAAFGGLALEDRPHPFATAGELEVPLVGEHDRLWPATSADHQRLGVGTGSAEALEHCWQLGAGLAGGEYLVGVSRHIERVYTYVYTKVPTKSRARWKAASALLQSADATARYILSMRGPAPRVRPLRDLSSDLAGTIAPTRIAYKKCGNSRCPRLAVAVGQRS